MSLFKNLFSGTDLRVRLALSIALPLLVLMSAFSLWQYLREIQSIQTENENNAQKVGDVMLMGLRHAMLTHDAATITAMIQNTSGMEDLERVILLDQNSVVKADSASSGNEIGQTINPRLTDGCLNCHQFQQNLPRTLSLTI